MRRGALATNPVELFAAFARHEVDADAVFRAVTAYDAFIVTQPGLGSPLGELWAYTDGAAVGRARDAGSDIGPLVSGVSGIDLFSALPAGLRFVRLNPVSPPELTWNVPAEAFAFAQAWANGARFEREVAAWAAGKPVAFDALVGYAHYLCYLTPDRAVLTMPNQYGLVNGAVVCTAPDCGRAVLARVPDTLRVTLTPVFATGDELAAKLPEQGVDGVIINPAGPGPTCPVRLTAKP